MKSHQRHLPKNSAAFINSKRDDMTINRAVLDNPSPIDYQQDVFNDVSKKKDLGDRRPFGVNQQRFGKDDNGVPGAG